MWFPELFARIEKYGGSACAPADIAVNSTAAPATQSPDLANTIYLESFLTALANLPGNILTVLIIDRVGRKILLSKSNLLSIENMIIIYLLICKFEG